MQPSCGVVDLEGVGVGTADVVCVPEPLPAFTSETQASVVELVEARVAPVLRSAPFTPAAVDTALLDLAGRALVPVHALLGGSFRDLVEVHGSVGWTQDPADMVATATAQARTYRTLKLYPGRGALTEDLERLAAVRDAVGEGAGLFVDINGMWSQATSSPPSPGWPTSGSGCSNSRCRCTPQPSVRAWSPRGGSRSSPTRRSGRSRTPQPWPRPDRRPYSTSVIPSWVARQRRCRRRRSRRRTGSVSWSAASSSSASRTRWVCTWPPLCPGWPIRPT